MSTIDETVAEYERQLPGLEQFSNDLQEELEWAIREAGLKPVSIEARVKTPKSLREKIQRRNYNDPLAEIEDFVGVRIVCLFMSDLEAVGNLIHRRFEVTEAQDKTESLGIERMGYQGRHFIVKPRSPEAGSIGARLLKAELQVRTILQDAWARMSHKLIYKYEASVPHKVHRELNNVSSLLEIAQNVFDRSRETQENYAKEIEETAKNPSKLLDQPIDRETLAAYTKYRFPELSVDGKIQELLLRDLDQKSFKTLGDIDLAVTAASDAVEAYQLENPGWFKSGTDFLTKSLGFYSKTFRDRHPFGGKTRAAFNRHEAKVRHSANNG